MNPETWQAGIVYRRRDWAGEGTRSLSPERSSLGDGRSGLTHVAFCVPMIA